MIDRNRRPSNGPPSWFWLFDTGEMDHVCALVRSEVEEASRGEQSSLGIPIRDLLVRPADDYIAAHRRPGQQVDSVMAAERFRDYAADLSGRFERRHPFAQDDGLRDATRLRFAWLEFIAYGSAYMIYSKRAKLWERNQTISKLPRGRAAKLTAEDVAGAIQAQGVSLLTDDQAQRIAKPFKASVRTVYRRLAEARKKGLLP